MYYPQIDKIHIHVVCIIIPKIVRKIPPYIFTTTLFFIECFVISLPIDPFLPPDQFHPACICISPPLCPLLPLFHCLTIPFPSISWITSFLDPPPFVRSDISASTGCSMSWFPLQLAFFRRTDSIALSCLRIDHSHYRKRGAHPSDFIWQRVKRFAINFPHLEQLSFPSRWIRVYEFIVIELYFKGEIKRMYSHV